MKKGLFLVIFAFIGAACSSSKIKTLDTEIDPKGNSNLGVIGIKDDRVVIQKETNAQDELRVQQFRNERDEDKLSSETYRLASCREQVVDPRLGGNGDVEPMKEIDQMKEIAEVKEEFGLDKDQNLKFVTKEDFLKRIAIERKYAKTLATMIGEVKKASESCRIKLGAIRVKYGLPADRDTWAGNLDGEMARLHLTKLSLQ